MHEVKEGRGQGLEEQPEIMYCLYTPKQTTMALMKRVIIAGSGVKETMSDPSYCSRMWLSNRSGYTYDISCQCMHPHSTHKQLSCLWVCMTKAISI